jgi:hypothetical protein
MVGADNAASALFPPALARVSGVLRDSIRGAGVLDPRRGRGAPRLCGHPQFCPNDCSSTDVDVDLAALATDTPAEGADGAAA